MTDPRRMIETEGEWMRQLLLANHGDRAPTRVHTNVERLLGTAWVGTEVVEVAKEASTQSGALQAAQLAPAVPLTQAASISAASLGTAGASSAVALQATTTPVGVALGSSTSGLALSASGGVASHAAGASLSAAVKGGIAKLAANVVSWSLGTKLLVGASILSAGGAASWTAWKDPEPATHAVSHTAHSTSRGASAGPVSAPRGGPSVSNEARQSADTEERTEVHREPFAITEASRLQPKEVTDLPLVETEEHPKKTARARARPRPRASTLQEELRYIRVARAALKAGNPESARRALDAYRRKFPAGKLKPEARGLRRLVARQQTSK